MGRSEVPISMSGDPAAPQGSRAPPETSLDRIQEVEASAIVLLVLQTLFLGGWVMTGLHVLS